MGWLGLDDTDSLANGCTTYSMHLLLQSLPSTITASCLRLVRLWPFAQRRTRGNAAVAVELTSEKETEIVEYLNNFWNDNLMKLCGKKTSSSHDNREQFPADPGMVWFSSKRPPFSFYTSAVQHEVNIEEVPVPDCAWGGYGRIGATAAVAWDGENCTWEAIAWRVTERHGTLERKVCSRALESVDNMPSTFLSRDPRHGRGLVSPRGPCPVLFGVRARDFQSSQSAGEVLCAAEFTEPVEFMRVFTTNQASDDHLPPSLHSTVVRVEILKRGNCIIHTEHGKWMAFAETGDVKLLAQSLIAGDRVEGIGLVHESGTIHLEKLRVTESFPFRDRPFCHDCNVRMKSMGREQGSRCPQCKSRTESQWVESLRTPLFSSWVQPPSDSRRHLARPLDWD